MNAGVVAALVSSVAALVVGLLTTIHQRRSADDANDTERFVAITTALEHRIASLESDVAYLRGALADEQQAHRRTGDRLRVALVHIRAVIEWSNDERVTPIPAPPPELLAEL